MFNLTREEVKKDISCSPSHAITTDAWTSPKQESFITTTVNYINPINLQLCSNMLDTLEGEEHHTTDVLAADIQKVAITWGLKEIKVTSDNAANIVAAVRSLGVPHV